MSVMSRRFLLSAGATLSVAGMSARSRARAATSVRFSYQKSSALLLVLKSNGRLAASLSPLGCEPVFSEFTSVMEPMNAGVVDFHADCADAVPIFTQAAGAELTYYAKELPSPHAEAIIVPASSPIKAVSDLAGRTIAVQKGSGAHYLLIAALGKAGLSVKDVTIAYLQAPDASAAFQNGSIDAWSIWDPFLAIAEARSPVRILADGADGLTDYTRYYMVGTDFASRNPEIVKAVFGALAEAGAWMRAHPAEAASLLAPVWGDVPVPVIAKVNSRRSYDVAPVTAVDLESQQKLADVFHDAGLIPTSLNTSAVPIWRPS
ncbi:sulfonate transport system substrate-binding protein [Arboricoccus pini]|uniref:Putative aliphatic sulfonates-binding protein n=1 Tax=Arboricoccus pini TaxID=1963835 RepID=A0A212RVA5_9PROT|nr:aliphatic sulfonate ABC transporter substrate-binding protein [Arboricoccus pini]SNB76666.1 sulfonate transport system substrate-binding protein [Arboricoccus pini]